jgi:hypothetical protein
MGRKGDAVTTIDREIRRWGDEEIRRQKEADREIG